MPELVKVAAVQMNPRIGENRYNLEHILGETRAASDSGAALIVFPECALTGYVFSSREEAMEVAEESPGRSVETLEALCREIGAHLVFGLLEKDGINCYNTAVLLGPGGLIGRYRKNHLPYLGVDRFVDAGNEPFKVHQTAVGNIGMLICYDCNFPESSRILALLKAEIIVLPTNWPKGRETVADIVVNTRAFENKVNLVAVNRVGVERGAEFFGRSQIITSSGVTVAEAGRNEETIYAEVDLEKARQKRIVIVPDEFEVDFLADRRPDLYGEITKKP